MEGFRAAVAALAMLFFGAVVLIGWGITMIVPILSGQRPFGNIGLLLFWSAVSLGVWRLAAGPGWGLKPDAQTATPASQAIPSSWVRALMRHGVTIEAISKLLDELYEDELTLPARADVFRAFRLTHPEDVRVVIIGQDPYHRRGLADGLAFSVRDGRTPPSSLASIFRALESDPAIMCTPPANSDLSRWANQGVLLLNAALTVEEGEPGSDLKIWHSFTSSVLKALNERTEPIVFLAFGDDAVDLVTEANVSSPHKVIEMAHPVAWAKTNLPKVGDAKPFSAANAFLTSHGRGHIDW